MRARSSQKRPWRARVRYSVVFRRRVLAAARVLVAFYVVLGRGWDVCILHGCQAVVCGRNNDRITHQGWRTHTCAMTSRYYFNRRCVSKQNATRHLVGPRAIADDVLLVRCAHRHGGGRWQAPARIRACPVRQLSPFQTTSGSTALLTFARKAALRTLLAPPAAVDALAAS